MKVRIISSDFILPMGTVLDVGTNPPRSWVGQYEVVDPLDHDGDGVKGGAWNVDRDKPVPVEIIAKDRRG